MNGPGPYSDQIGDILEDHCNPPCRSKILSINLMTDEITVNWPALGPMPYEMTALERTLWTNPRWQSKSQTSPPPQPTGFAAWPPEVPDWAQYQRVPIPGLRCECGVDKCGGGKHSDWCPKHEVNT